MNAPTLNRRLWAGAVLRAVAKVPAGDKLPIAAIARQLGITQAAAISSVELLVGEGRLDRATLRPPVVAVQHECGGCAPPVITFEPVTPALAPPVSPPASLPPAGGIPSDISGQAMFDLLVAEGKRRGLSIGATSLQVFGNKSQIHTLPKRALCADVTIAKAQAWQDRAPPPPADNSVVLQQLLADVETFLTDHRMSANAFGKGALNNGALVRQLRLGVLAPTPRSIDRIRAFMANPPARKPQLPRKAPTRSMSGEQHAAAVRRGVGQQALAILDGDSSALTTGGKIAASVRGAMQVIQDQRDAAARLADPTEQAALALRQRGRVVFDASVSGGTKGRFFVSGQHDPDTGKRLQLTPADLTALAWKVNPLRMQQLTGLERPDARR